MSIEIVSLTPKGEALSKSVRHDNNAGWRVIYFLRRMGGRSTVDTVAAFCFGGDISSARSTISLLSNKNILVRE